jgi:hypothetical protein
MHKLGRNWEVIDSFRSSQSQEGWGAKPAIAKENQAFVNGVRNIAIEEVQREAYDL